MPRQPRLDAPGTLHHIMGRGIERTAIFRSDEDRADFVTRLAALARAGAWAVYAWALLPNHFHLLVRTGQRPLFQIPCSGGSAVTRCHPVDRRKNLSFFSETP